ncbi:Phage replication protein, DnaD domain [Oceanobacillus limi]|uniref:Phage replication protein, DnaD domain n=1 Tax=Oceanobacillus limi TaxID=930131 RepID=A0A1H9Y1G1_9BACI|nr:DnaD domain protein [Oceanobacillus limi]SES62081.1 Phage replication protein, DnaD domain [Oceanobacillus limi]
MEYFKEMKAFKEWLLLNELSTSAVALWYTLMTINNSVGWKSKFNVANATVQKLTGLSKQGLADARKKLMEHDLIMFEKGAKGRAPKYQMVSLVSHIDRSPDPKLDQSLDRSADQSLTIPRERHRQKDRRGETRAEKLIQLHETSIGRLSPVAREEFLLWMEEVGADMLEAAIKHAAKHGARSFRYVERILEEWVDNNLVTVEAVNAFQKQKGQRIHNTIPFPNKERDQTKALFDEMRREGS